MGLDALVEKIFNKEDPKDSDTLEVKKKITKSLLCREKFEVYF